MGDIGNLYAEWKELVKQGVPLEAALKLVSSNPARRVGIFQDKGSIDEGKDADLLIVAPDLDLESVMAKGRLLVHEGRVVVKGTFEP
jgi:beta-aspartyl-dipeptidase (metallo-type)